MGTLRDALERLSRAGFGDDLDADGPVLPAIQSGQRHDPADLVVATTVRFELLSHPADEAVVFARVEPVG